MTVSVIIVAAGSSVRMGFDKLAAPLGGIPVLQRSLNVFLSNPAVAEIIVVCPPERWERLETNHPTLPIHRVDGGADRQRSVANGLAVVSPSATHVAVHDGARPLLHPADLEHCLQAAAADGAAALARRVTDTLKRSDEAGLCTASVCRDNLWRMETPQIFATALLREAHAAVAARDLTVTDEVSAIEAIARPVRFVESVHPNPKITRPADIILATAILTHP